MLRCTLHDRLRKLLTPAGGAMLVKPLLHASNRSTSERPRRVIHQGFLAAKLPEELAWRERRAVEIA